MPDLLRGLTLSRLLRLPLLALLAIVLAMQDRALHGQAGPPHTLYFAEGATGFFTTSIDLVNPSATDTATAKVTFVGDAGPVGTKTISLAPGTSQSLSLNTEVGVVGGFATIVESNIELFGERHMSWGEGGYGSSLERGVRQASPTWYFAEGATGVFDLYYLLLNPGTAPADVTIQFLPEAGPPVNKTVTVAPLSRYTVRVMDFPDPELQAASFGAALTSTVPIVAEQAMYASSPTQFFAAGSASAATPTLATTVHFAEGATGTFFDEFLLLVNPSATTATATILYRLPDGTTLSKAYPIEPQRRVTVWLNYEAASDPALAALASTAVAVTVTSDLPIAVTRKMYWPGLLQPGGWGEASDAAGATTTTLNAYIARAMIGGADQAATWVLIANTSADPGQIQITVTPAGGGDPVIETYPIPGNARLTVNLAEFGIVDQPFSVAIESLASSPAVPIVVEVSSYTSPGGQFWAAGSASAASVPEQAVGDSAPTVTATTPATGATNVAVDGNLTVTFSEPVNAAAGAFTLTCGVSAITLTNLSASPATTFTLDPTTDLPLASSCTLTVVAAEITDVDADDPPDTPTADTTVTFTTSTCATITVSPTTVPGGTLTLPYGPVTFTQTGGTPPITWTVTTGTLPAGLLLDFTTGVLSGTPTAAGPFAFTVTATDANACTGAVPLTLSVLSGPNQAPSFVGGPAVTVLEDAGVQTLVGWATGISPGPAEEAGQVVSFVVTGNTNAALFSIAPAVSSAGVLTFTPAPNANGTATITLVAQDTGGTALGGVDTSAPQSFTITVTPVNDAPSFVKGADPITVVEDSGLTTLSGWATGISAGPADEAGQVLTFTLTGNTSPGLFAVQPALDAATGTLTFTLQPNLFGTTTLTWTLSDAGGTATGGIDTAAPQTVTITVASANDPPTAVDDAGTTDEDTVLTVPTPGVLANDLDPDTVDTRAVTAVNGAPANVGTPITLASGALLTVNADGSYAYDPTAVTAFQALAPGQSAVESFTYTMQDALGLSSSATVTITITGVNDVPALDLDLDNDGGTPPTTGTGFATTFTDGGPPTFIQDEVDATITDVDSATLSSLTVTITNVLDNLQEKLDVDLVTGGFDATFTKVFDETTTPGAAVLTLTAATPQPIASFNTLLRRVTYQNLDIAPDVTTPRVITFVVNDGAGTSNTATSTVTIVAVDSPPTANNDAYSVAEGGTLTVAAPGVLAGDVDPEGDTPITAVLVTGPANASSFTLNADGSFTYTHNGSETTTDAFTYQASANGLVSNVATVTVTITSVNDPPTAVDDTNTTTEDAPVSAAAPGVLANDTDPDVGDTKAVSAVNGVPGNVGIPTATAKGASVTLNANGSYTYTPGSVFQSLGTGQTDTDTFTYTMQDAAAAPSNVATVTITITGANDAPVVTAGGGAAVFTEDGAAVAVTPALTVTDADSPTLASATVQITANYVNGQDVLALPLTPGIAGAFDPVTGTLTLTGPATVAAFQAALQSVTYSNTSQNPSTLARTVQVQVNDGTLTSTPSTRTVTVAAVNDAPVVTAGTTITFTEGDAATAIATTFTVTDVDDTNLEAATAQITANYVNGQDVLALPVTPGITGAFNPVNGTLTLTGSATVAAYQAALRTVTYINGSNNPSQAARTVTFLVNDGNVNSNGATSTITVIAVNDAPIVANETFDVLGNTELRVDLPAGTTPHTSETTTGVSAVKGVLDNDGDPEGDPFAVTAIANCTAPDTTAPFDCTLTGGAVVHVEATGEFSYTPAPGATSGSFTYTVTDTPGQGLPASVAGTVTFTVFDMIWYVDADAPAGGNGTSRLPFNTLTAGTLNGANGAGDLDDADDYIFIHASPTAIAVGIELEVGQHLIGEGAGLSINRNLNGNGAPTNLVPAGTRPVITNAAGNAVAVTEALPSEISGLTLGGVNAIDITTDAPLTGATSLTIAGNLINSASAEGIDVNVNAGTTGTLTLAIAGNSWNLANTHAGTAVDITRAAGTLSLAFSGNTDIVSANAAGAAVLINGGAAANTTITAFANNTIHGNTVGNGVMITAARFDQDPVTAGYQLVAAGVMNVGASGNRVGAAGMILNNVSGDLSFADLNVFADNGPALFVGGTGPVNVGAGTGTRVAVTTGAADLHAVGGPAVRVSDGTIGLQLATMSATTATNGVVLTNVTGQFSAPSGSTITKASGTGAAFFVDNSAAGTTALTSTYGGTINNTSGTGGSVLVNTADAGSSLSFTGAITDNPGTGIVLNGNTGATIAFSGGLTLNGAASVFAATGGGTLTVTGTNTIGATTPPTATALNVANTSIGSAGLTFRSISAGTGAGSAGNGIILDNTGTAAGNGGLTVTGNSAAGSGGTIQHKTGSDGSTTSGIGIYLNNTKNPSFNWMQLNDFQNFGIRGNDVTGFIFDNSVLSGTNGTTAGASDEAAISFNNLLGSASISNSNISNGFEYILKVLNTSGTLNRLTVDNTDFGTNNTALGGDAFQIVASNTATVNVTVTDSGFSNAREDLFNAVATQTADMDLVFRDNTLSNNHTNKVSAASNLLLFSTSTGDVTYDMSHNTLTTGATGSAIAAAKGVPDSGSGGTMVGTINANTVGVTGVAGSGSEFTGIFASALGSGTHTTAITNNIVRRYNEEGIFLKSNDPLTGGNAVLNATLAGNQTLEPDSLAFAGLWVVAGSGSGTETHTVNVVLGNISTSAVAGSPTGSLQNDFTAGDPANGSDVFLQESGSGSVINLSRAGSVSGTAAGVVQDDNVGTPTVVAAGTINLVSTLPTTPPPVTP